MYDLKQYTNIRVQIVVIQNEISFGVPNSKLRNQTGKEYTL